MEGEIGKGGWGGSSVCRFVPPIREIWAPCWWAHAEETLHHCSLSRMRPIWRLVIVATGDLTTDFARGGESCAHSHRSRQHEWHRTSSSKSPAANP